MQLPMKDMLGVLMEVTMVDPMEVLKPMEVMKVVDMSNRTGQDTMKTSHME